MKKLMYFWIAFGCALTVCEGPKDHRPGMVEATGAPIPYKELWIVIKFRGQEDTSAGIAFPETGDQVPTYRHIFTKGTYFKDIKKFQKELSKRPEINLSILSDKSIKSRGIDPTIFQSFDKKDVSDDQ